MVAALFRAGRRSRSRSRSSRVVRSSSATRVSRPLTVSTTAVDGTYPRSDPCRDGRRGPTGPLKSAVGSERRPWATARATGAEPPTPLAEGAPRRSDACASSRMTTRCRRAHDRRSRSRCGIRGAQTHGAARRSVRAGRERCDPGGYGSAGRGRIVDPGALDGSAHPQPRSRLATRGGARGRGGDPPDAVGPMKVADANVLLHVVNQDAVRHDASRRWLDAVVAPLRPAPGGSWCAVAELRRARGGVTGRAGLVGRSGPRAAGLDRLLTGSVALPGERTLLARVRGVQKAENPHCLARHLPTIPNTGRLRTEICRTDGAWRP